MARPRRLLIDPKQPQSMVDMIEELTLVGEAGTSFGNPQDPDERDLTSTTLAGAAAASHPGTLENIEGSWVEVEFTDPETAVTCHHNLGVAVVSATAPNVRWIPFMFQHDGTQKTWWDDLRTPATSAHRGARTPTWAVWLAKLTRGVWLDWFGTAPGSEEEVFFNIQMPHNWREGTDVYPHVHWVPSISAAAADQCVKWGLEYTWANIGAVFAFPDTIYTDATDDSTQTIQAEQLVANTHYVSEFVLPVNGFPPLDGAGKTLSSMLVCRLFRNTADASDDYLGSAGLLEFDLHYEIDGPGSEAEASKTKPVASERSPFSIYYDPADTVAENNIPLRIAADPHVEIDGSHKLKVSLFFIRGMK